MEYKKSMVFVIGFLLLSMTVMASDGYYLKVFKAKADGKKITVSGYLNKDDSKFLGFEGLNVFCRHNEETVLLGSVNVKEDENRFVVSSKGGVCVKNDFVWVEFDGFRSEELKVKKKGDNKPLIVVDTPVEVTCREVYDMCMDGCGKRDFKCRLKCGLDLFRCEHPRDFSR